MGDAKGTKTNFLPKALAKRLFMRVVFFAIGVTAFLSLINVCSTTMNSKATGPNFTEVNGLVDSGPFAVTRNPLYVGMFVTLPPAFAILADSWAMIASLGVLMPLYIHSVVIPAEEKLMSKLFGEKYEKYCAETPRYLF